MAKYISLVLIGSIILIPVMLKTFFYFSFSSLRQTYQGNYLSSIFKEHGIYFSPPGSIEQIISLPLKKISNP